MAHTFEKAKWRFTPGPIISDYITAYRKVHPKWPDPVCNMGADMWVRIETFGSISAPHNESMMQQAIADLEAIAAKRAPRLLPPSEPKPVKRGKAHERIIGMASKDPIVLTHDPDRGDKFTFRGKPIGFKVTAQCVSEGWLKPRGDGLFETDSQTFVAA